MDTTDPVEDALAAPARLQSLHRAGLAAATSVPAFDRLARIAATALGAPLAYVTALDVQVQYLPGVAAPADPRAAIRCTPVSDSMCRHVVAAAEAVCVSDAEEHPLGWNGVPFPDGVRAYLGVPLRTPSGDVLGSVCVVDRVPRRWEPRDRELLDDLAAAATTEIELRMQMRERATAEAALRDSERLFRSLIENANDMVLLLDGDHVIRYVSPACERATGIPVSSLVGQVALDGVHPDELAAAREALALAAERAGDPVRVVFRHRHGDGSWRWIAAVVTDLLHDPAVRGIVVNSRDVTERRRLEEELRHAQKMEAVGRLAGGIAHDFNNVLTAIRAHGQFAGELVPPDSPVSEELDAIRLATERAITLTGQLLAFSRKQRLQPARLDLNLAVAGLTTMLGRVIGEDIVLQTELAPTPCPVDADPAQLQQVVMNLVVNARDAMPDGGTLLLRTAHVNVKGGRGTERLPLEPGPYVALAVEDSGTGISPAVLPHIFEPFFTTKDQGRGTGLGLAMVYGTVQQSGGHVRVDTVPGVGSRFTVLLPRASSADAVVSADCEPERDAPRGGRETLLLVEDEPMVRDVARRALERQGYVVREAADGVEAEREWASHASEIDMLVTDAVMPVLGGRALIERLRQQRPDLPVLIVTGYERDEIGTEGPPIAVLQKPFTPAELARRVREVLDG